jgi:hypothetical protein
MRMSKLVTLLTFLSSFDLLFALVPSGQGNGDPPYPGSDPDQDSQSRTWPPMHTVVETIERASIAPGSKMA